MTKEVDQHTCAARSRGILLQILEFLQDTLGRHGASTVPAKCKHPYNKWNFVQEIQTQTTVISVYNQTKLTFAQSRAKKLKKPCMSKNNNNNQRQPQPQPQPQMKPKLRASSKFEADPGPTTRPATTTLH